MNPSDHVTFERKALWIARSFRGKSVSDLATDAGVSRQVVSAIENGSAPPYKPALAAIATALKFPLTFFFQAPLVPERSVFHFRRAAAVPEYSIHKAMAHAALFASVVHSFGRFAQFRRARLPVALPSSNDAIELAAETFRAAIGLRADTPIANAVRAVEAAGVFVGTFDPESMPIYGYAWHQHVPVIMLSTTSPWSRRRFSVMHEAGHLVLHRDSSPEDREAHANRFAGAVLVPQAAFRREFPRPNGRELSWAALIAMKRRWGVSIQALIHRAFDLNMIDAIQYRTANIHITKYGWRTNEPGELPLEQPEICTTILSELRKRSDLGTLCSLTCLYPEDIGLAAGVLIEYDPERSGIMPAVARSPERS